MKLYEGIQQKMIRAEKAFLKPHKNHLDVYYWTLVVTILAIFASSIILFPIILSVQTAWLYLIVIFIGASFGLIFDHFIIHNPVLKQYHHLQATTLVFVVAVSMMFFTTVYTNEVAAIYGLRASMHNPFELAMLYAFSFLIP